MGNVPSMLLRTVKAPYRSKGWKVPTAMCQPVKCETLEKLHWKTLKHPPCSPDLSPCDHLLLGQLKRAMGGEIFENGIQMAQFVQNWIFTQPTNFYNSAINKLKFAGKHV